MNTKRTTMSETSSICMCDDLNRITKELEKDKKQERKLKDLLLHLFSFAST